MDARFSYTEEYIFFKLNISSKQQTCVLTFSPGSKVWKVKANEKYMTVSQVGVNDLKRGCLLKSLIQEINYHSLSFRKYMTFRKNGMLLRMLTGCVM